MTRREFDATTKCTGRESGRRLDGKFGPWMASDERAIYRASRMRDLPAGVDRLAVRWAYRLRRGKSPLWIGSPHRAPALYRAGLHPCSP